jgi:2,4-dienoyl-CoA reductase-like NADH-dependent reductase (Old Yellow Enzyme family)
MSNLFKKIQVGDISLPNRVVMAPLTRCRSGAGRVPNHLMAQYYAERAAAGLIISEATSVSPQGVGYPDSPGIWSEEQVKGWSTVTQAVHDAGGRIMMQLWHVGRVSHSLYLNGDLPVAPSSIAIQGPVRLLRPEHNYEVPRALELAEIPSIIEGYKKGAENAKRAGFDGVEIHAANGYLLDQFLQDGTNHRDDKYGGRLENRSRLLLEVTDAVVSVWGAGKVGVHLSPRGDTHDMGDSNPSQTFGYVAEQLGQRNIAFIFTRESQGDDSLTPLLKKCFGGVIIANEGFTKETAEKVILAGDADAVAFGKDFISNPDLVQRLKLNAGLNPYDMDTFYGCGLPNPVEGYLDYPLLKLEC